MSDLVTEASAEQQRDWLRDLCLRSTYAFATVVCRYPDLQPALHGAMAEWIDRPAPRGRKLGIAPRDHLKTSVWTIPKILRRATEDPHRRILLSNEVIAKPIKWINEMQGIVQSPIYRWLFPDVVPDPEKVRWNQTQIELKRDRPLSQPTIEGIGVGSSRTGDHYDEIHEDDLVGEDARESQLVMQRAINHHTLSESMLVRPTDPITTVGTRWGPNDLIDHMLRHEPDIDVFFLSYRNPDGTLIWPERFTDDYFERLRIKYGPAFFALNYENRVLAGGGTEFDPTMLGGWNYVADASEPTIELVEPKGLGRRQVRLSSMAKFQVLDAGLSPESVDARTANVVVGLTPPSPTRPFDVVILEARATKSDPAGAVENAAAVYDRWDPICIAVECVGGHETFFYWIPSVYPEMRLRKLKTDRRKSKETRIREFYPFCVQGRVFVNRATRDGADFLEEYESFPKGRTVDLLDALAYTPQIWGAPSPEKPIRPRPPGVTDFDLADMDPEDFIGPGGADGRSSVTGY